MRLNVDEIARMTDLSAVTAEATEADVRGLAALARQWNCVAVFALPGWTPLLCELTSDLPGTVVGGVIGFPAGGTTTSAKAGEARELLKMGCAELDMVINVGRLRSGHDASVLDDVRAVVEAAEGKPVKVILECHHLTDDQIRRGCELCVEAGVAWVKTGTGWAPTGATLENIALMSQVVNGRAGVKAAGGVRGLDTLIEMYRRGARRFGIGAASALKIFEQCAKLPERAVELEMPAGGSV